MQIATRLNAFRAAAVTGMFLAMSSAHAALPEGTQAEIDKYKEDAVLAIGAVLAAGVAIWGLKKLGQKLGWF